jgi:hypothetical protein
MPDPSPSLMQRMAKMLRMKKEEVPEEVSKALPEAVMPRKAVEKKRAQLKQLDEETKD